ncbi:MAG: peptidoglycan DD-metalloendopeptidase family protein [Spirochaetes bacterium]|jgi:murein DD-endopeptidase MepM/ murein hydrolase activator NlpD|nr:peptidoglycan DD-metalloendopeptidase family protein [Spirochaetota bacterium]
MKLTRSVIFGALVVIVIGSCAKEVVEEEFSPTESHANYREALARLDLESTEMGEAWFAAERSAMERPAALDPPAAEVVFLDPREPGAVGYRFPVSRGRRVEILIEAEHDRYFADVFRIPEGDDAEPVLVASRPDGENLVAFEARSNEYYLLRLQPELLRGGRFEVRITTGAALAFPVEEASAADIWSFFGDDRDGGRRIHHGVDIFAPRGTPVLATGDARVTRVGRRDRGGNVIVLRDEERGIMLYYAHLEEQLARRGQEVTAGDVIGTVGNTGNARTTPPHLHIGIYQGGWRRPVDPWAYFIDPPLVDPPAIEQAELVGGWARVARRVDAPAELPRAPGGRVAHANRNPFLQGAGDTFDGAEADLQSEPGPPPAPFVTELAAGTAARVTGASGNRLRLTTSDGETGYVELSALATADSVGTERTLAETHLLRDPRVGDAFGELEAGARVTTVGETTRGSLVLLPSGRAAILDPVPGS